MQNHSLIGVQTKQFLKKEAHRVTSLLLIGPFFYSFSLIKQDYLQAALFLLAFMFDGSVLIYRYLKENKPTLLSYDNVLTGHKYVNPEWD